ncbi:GFA family protein [Cucumibacter marinus]|uniref:GFA family protein n=1 Tax=Cucumibacter marinus TaxID=1121252 RepID=UPI000423AAB4|nr:hypothetical protein [Cucumibacter marinus]
MPETDPMKFCCACGGVEMVARGKPIAVTACCCDDCQAGSKAIEALPGAAPILQSDGGTPYILCRKDRVSVVRGQELIEGRKLKPNSPTTRYHASCCNTGLYTDFGPGHWYSMFATALVGKPPPIEMRVQTKHRPDGAVSPDDAPIAPGYPISFMFRLLGARAAMLFGR